MVFYTGLNSNGDLYIGNRKIDAITGEEVFLESATLVDSDDDTEDIGNLVTTFDTPVTFISSIVPTVRSPTADVVDTPVTPITSAGVIDPTVEVIPNPDNPTVS